MISNNEVNGSFAVFQVIIYVKHKDAIKIRNTTIIVISNQESFIKD